MDSIAYPRGSEWRKWDLEVHTPFSALNNGFGEKFNEYATSLFRLAVEKKIAVIGVTDYFAIEGYKGLREMSNDKSKLNALLGTELADKARNILLLPNIELRTSIIITDPDGTDNRVNFNLIFSNEISPNDIDEHFLRELKFTAESNPDSPDECWSLTILNLENLGKKLKAEHKRFQGKSDLWVGMTNAVVSHEKVTEVLERQASRFNDRYLVAVPADEDLSKCNWNGQGHLTRKLILQKSHILFSGNVNTREFGLGKKHTTVQEFINEFKSLKPCVHGSDAHDYGSLFEPQQSRYTWVKADPTFQGLRQILNEPEERSFVGSVPPSITNAASRLTKIIDNVRISKKHSSTTEEKWFDCSLSLNPELVAIIGNKGSGKSALADTIGLLGNTPRYSSFSFLNEEKFREPKNNKSKSFEASLAWADRTVDGPSGLDCNPDPYSVEKVRYIPQNYLETICNEVGIGKESRFYKELQQVIFSHVPESERLGRDTLDELLEDRGAEVNKTIEMLVTELQEVNKRIFANEDRLVPRYKKGLESQLNEKKRELQAHEHTKPMGIPKPEDDPETQQQSKKVSEVLEQKQKSLGDIEAKLAGLRKRDAHLAQKQAVSEKLRTKLENLERYVHGALKEAAPEFREFELEPNKVVSFRIDYSEIDNIIRRLDSERQSIAAKLDADQSDSIEQQRVNVTKEIDSLKSSLSAPHRAYQEYLQKLSLWDKDRAKIIGSPDMPGSIMHIEHALAEIDRLPQILREIRRKRDRKTLEIYREKKKLLGYYESYYGAVQNFLNKHPLTAGERFKVAFNVTMLELGFSSYFLDKINQRNAGSFMGVMEGSKELNDLLIQTNWSSPRSALRFIRKLMQKLESFDGQTMIISKQLRQGITPLELYNFIFSLSYISPIYRLTWDGKSLEQLSPGERGNLLLIFYLLVDRDDIPLVIDQPEENLDNQTVVRTLVPCMKDAKSRRQIIMVTHNPNLAVVCDAEQVIYAEIHKKLGNKVAYVSGSIENPIINKKIVDVLEGTRPAFDKREAKYLP
jgi:ABC-type lipoprotein export system ATPase subunit